MYIIVGLGNPGEKFKNTRHNVGFMALDEFAKNSDFKLQKKFNAEISELPDVGSRVKNILLVKPQTFMNDSGKSVRKITTHYKLPTTNLVVVHDDIDLPIGKIKVVKDRGSAGHKGVESIINSIGSGNFVRFRIGIAPEKNIEAKKIVLKKFSKEEKEVINNAIKKTCEALNYFLQNGLEKTMNEYNK